MSMKSLPTYTRFMRWMHNSARRPPSLGLSPWTSAIGPPLSSYETTGRFQFTDAPHLHYIFPHFCCLTFTNFMSITVITNYNPCITNIITGACPAYCCWPRCHHSQTINLCPTAVRNCPRLPEKAVHHIVLQQYCQPQRPCKPPTAVPGGGRYAFAIRRRNSTNVSAAWLIYLRQKLQ